MHRDGIRTALLETRLLGKRMGLRLWEVVDRRLHHGHTLVCHHHRLLLRMRWQTNNRSVGVDGHRGTGDDRACRRHHEIPANRGPSAHSNAR